MMKKGKLDERFGQEVVFGSYSSKGEFFKRSVLIFLVLFTFGFCFYEFYWIKRPEYAFKMLNQAIAERNINQFRKYVNMPKLADELYTPLLQNTDIYANGIGGQTPNEDFLRRTQRSVKAILTQKIEEYIENGAFTVSQGWAGDVFEIIKEQSGYNDAVFEKAELRMDSDTPTIVIEAYNREFNYSYVLTLIMQKSETGDWQVAGIDGLSKYFTEYHQVQNEKLNELNTPIRQTIAAAITVSDVNAEFIQNETATPNEEDEKTEETTLVQSAMFKCDLAVDAAKKIDDYTLRFCLNDSFGNEVLSYDINSIKVEKPKAAPKAKNKKQKQVVVEEVKTGLKFVSAVNDESGKEIGLLFEYSVEVDLSKSKIPTDKLKESGLSGYKAIAEVININFSDGSQLKVLEKLPEEM